METVHSKSSKLHTHTHNRLIWTHVLVDEEATRVLGLDSKLCVYEKGHKAEEQTAVKGSVLGGIVIPASECAAN